MPNPEPYGVIKPKSVLFGCDNFATVLDEEAPYKNKQGMEMKRYLIIPHEHLIKQYPELQKPGALSYKNMAIWVEYPTHWISDTNPSRTNAIARIDCGFDGRQTAQTRRYKSMADEIKSLRKELDAAEISNIVLGDQIKILQGDVREYIKNHTELNEMMKVSTGGNSEGKEDES